MKIHKIIVTESGAKVNYDLCGEAIDSYPDGNLEYVGFGENPAGQLVHAWRFVNPEDRRAYEESVDYIGRICDATPVWKPKEPAFFGTAGYTFIQPSRIFGITIYDPPTGYSISDDAQARENH